MMILRAAQGGGYAAMGIVGGTMLVDPSQMITGQMDWMAPVWSVMMLLGGILGTTAMISRIWFFETTALPLLYAGSGMLGVAYLRQLPYTSGRFVAGVFCLGVACFLFAHWRVVYKFGNESIEARLYEKRSADGKY